MNGIVFLYLVCHALDFVKQKQPNLQVHLYFDLFWNGTFGSFLNPIVKEAVVEVSSSNHKSLLVFLLLLSISDIHLMVNGESEPTRLQIAGLQTTFVERFA